MSHSLCAFPPELQALASFSSRGSRVLPLEARGYEPCRSFEGLPGDSLRSHGQQTKPLQLDSLLHHNVEKGCLHCCNAPSEQYKQHSLPMPIITKGTALPVRLLLYSMIPHDNSCTLQACCHASLHLSWNLRASPNFLPGLAEEALSFVACA